MSINDVTGDEIKSGANSKEFEKNFDNIFNKDYIIVYLGMYINLYLANQEYRDEHGQVLWVKDIQFARRFKTRTDAENHVKLWDFKNHEVREIERL